MKPIRIPAATMIAAVALLLLTTAPATRPAPDPIPPPARHSAERGLHWLLAAQNGDGSWGDSRRTPGQVGNTCIAALALLAAGSTPTRGPHWRPLRRALEWLAPRARDAARGLPLDRYTLLQSKLGEHVDLYLLTLLQSQVAGEATEARDDRALLAELRANADRIAALQQPDGEWEASYEPMLTTACAWLALRGTASAGVAIYHASAAAVVHHLKRDCLEPRTGIFRERKRNRQPRFLTQAAALRVLCGMGEGASPAIRRAIATLAGMRFDQDVGGRSGGEEFLAALLATQALHLAREQPAFAIFYRRMVAALARCQNADGSWMGHHCITDRVFCTACSIMALLVPSQVMPMAEL